MSFWNTSEGKQATGNEAELVKEIQPIPDKTICRVMIDEGKWDEYQGERYISIAWSVIDGDYKNRKVFQKLKVYDSKATKADTHKEALMRLFMLTKTEVPQGEPTDMQLMKLAMKPLQIRCRVWEIEDSQTGDTKRGNWVDAIYPNTEIAAQSAPSVDVDEDVGF